MVNDNSGHKVGLVTSISGAKVIAVLDSEAVDASAANSDHAIGSGAMVKMVTPSSNVFGIISSLRMAQTKTGVNTAAPLTIEIDLMGEIPHPSERFPEPVFQRGVSVYPTLGTEVLATTREEMSRVYARPRASTVRVGTVHHDSSLPAYVVTDDLLGKHFAVLGTSGCGKSCALALILRAVLTEHPNAHVMLLDPHNEYAHAFTDMAELINPMNLQLPYWLLNFEESAAVMTGGQGLESESEQAILKNVITWARKKFMHDQGDTRFITVDTPVPYRLGDMTRQIDQEMGKLDVSVPRSRGAEHPLGGASALGRP